MNPAELLANLTALGVRLSIENGALRARAPAGVLTDQMRSDLTAHKEELLALLSDPGAELAAAVELIHRLAHEHRAYPVRVALLGMYKELAVQKHAEGDL